MTVAESLEGSIRESVPSPAFATQTDLGPTAIATGPRPTETVPVTEAVRGSIVITVPLS